MAPGWPEAAASAVNYAEHYRFVAAEYRRRAALARFPEMGAQLLRIAAHHDRLAALEWGERPPAPHAAPQSPGDKARRHVLQAQANVARQQALCARLAVDPRQAALRGQARLVLATLTQTLKLAREHLAAELAEESQRSQVADGRSRELASEVPAWRRPAYPDTT
jgi:hypothetical protein